MDSENPWKTQRYRQTWKYKISPAPSLSIQLYFSLSTVSILVIFSIHCFYSYILLYPLFLFLYSSLSTVSILVFFSILCFYSCVPCSTKNMKNNGVLFLTPIFLPFYPHSAYILNTRSYKQTNKGLSIYLFVYLSIYLFAYISLYLTIYL